MRALSEASPAAAAVPTDSGQVLWSKDLGYSSGGGIIIYLAGGRQFVGIAMRDLCPQNA